ncbi:MAG: CHRD domain-containing protein [Gemmatimonadaceae bacterium]|nr:CHRD domain-containing protein [Gemmatimonadaceae bacterium]
MPITRPARSLALALAVLGLVACDDDDDNGAPAPERFTAQLAGSNEVPPVTTTASGSATFTAVGDTALSYTITVSGLTGVTMGHIHSGAAGVNGPVLVWLAPPNGTAPQTPSGLTNGELSAGRINASWIRGVGGAPAISLDSLKRLLRTGNAYVNLHTSANAGGELRGQIVRP